MNSLLEDWQKRGKYVDIQSHSIFVIDEAAHNQETLFILHGYPSCSFDYHSTIGAFSQKYRVVLFDHLGFGLSDKPKENTYQLKDQAQIALSVLQALGIQKIHLIAHDYGTSVATEIIALHNENKLNIEISSVTLCNGSMLIDMAQLRYIQKALKNRLIGPLIAKLSVKYVFTMNMRNIWFDKEKVAIEELDALWDSLIYNDGRKILPVITRYIDQRYEHYDRWIGGLHKSKLPYLILWAKNDPVAVYEMAEKLEKLIQNTKLVPIDECGHYPMLEKPRLWSGAILDFLNHNI